MAQIVVSPNGKVCKSFVSTLVADNQIGPFSKTHLVVLIKNTIIAACFVTPHAHYLSTLNVSVCIKILNYAKRFVACIKFLLCCLVNSLPFWGTFTVSSLKVRPFSLLMLSLLRKV